MLFQSFDVKPFRIELVSIFSKSFERWVLFPFDSKGRQAVLSFAVLDRERKQQPRLAAGQALIWK